MDQLAKLLLENHAIVNGCRRTRYTNIPRLKILATTTNGTSGIGVYRGSRVAWYQEKSGKFTVVQD